MPRMQRKDLDRIDGSRTTGRSSKCSTSSPPNWQRRRVRQHTTPTKIIRPRRSRHWPRPIASPRTIRRVAPSRSSKRPFDASRPRKERQRAEQERRDTEEAGRHDAERHKLAEAARESAAERRRLETELRTAHALIGRARHEHVDPLELKFAQALCDHHHVDPSKPYA